MNKIRIAYLIIFTVLVTLAVFVANDRANANTDNIIVLSEYEPWSELGDHECHTFSSHSECYLYEIYQQNLRIEEKLDWNSCAVMYGLSNPYTLEKESSPAIVYNAVDDWCGDQP